MKTRHVVALSMLVGLALGALAVQGLHGGGYLHTKLALRRMDGPSPSPSYSAGLNARSATN
jgi:hypothetical protein